MITRMEPTSTMPLAGRNYKTMNDNIQLNQKGKYSTEYVEIKVSLEHIRTKLDMMENMIRNLHTNEQECYKQVEQNRADIAGIKATATVWGAVAGTLVATLSRFIFN